MRVARTKPHNNRAREVLTREYLEREYVFKNRSAWGIARELGVHQGVVIGQLKSLGFRVRPNASYNSSPNFGQYSEFKYTDILTAEYLQEEYIRKDKSAAQIGREIGTDSGTVLKYLRRQGFEIKSRAYYTQGERNSTYGIPRTAEWRSRISKANDGRIPWCKGLTKETDPSVAKVASKLMGRKRPEITLDKHPRWNGGKSFEPYTTEFNKQLKELIRQRDGYACQLCGVPEIECCERLHIHHIDYNKENCLPSNLISLCRGCNARANSNRTKWTQHFNAFQVRRL